MACGEAGKASDTPAAAEAPVQMLDPALARELRASFLEVAGSDRVAFEDGSTKLTPKARLRLERQALWLAENGFVRVRFQTESASAKGVEDRRLALRRAEAVQNYLQEFGVAADQFVGIDVKLGPSGGVVTLIDPFHFRDPTPRQAESRIGRASKGHSDSTKR